MAHAGYTLLGLIAGGRDGLSATLFYTTTYALTLLGAFGVVGLVRTETGGDDIRHFAGLASRSPLLAGSMAIFLLSLAGLPPVAGFFGKFYLFAAAMRSGANHGLLWLVALALCGSLVSLYYYLTVLTTIFGDESYRESSPQGFDLAQCTTVAALALGVLFLGLMPGILLQQIVASLR